MCVYFENSLLTLNEGRRAVLLSDTDTVALRVPVVGVWVSGGGCGGSSTRQHGPPPSPLRHPYTYPACLRYLMLSATTTTIATKKERERQSGIAAAGNSRAAASDTAFLVLHLPGGVSGGTPNFFEASALCSDGHGTRVVGRGGQAASSVAGFEQLDFSADVDVTVEYGDVFAGQGEGKGQGGGGGGGSGRGNKAVVIGRLRRVSSPAFAEPFRRAQESRRCVIFHAAELGRGLSSR